MINIKEMNLKELQKLYDKTKDEKKQEIIENQIDKLEEINSIEDDIDELRDEIKEKNEELRKIKNGVEE